MKEPAVSDAESNKIVEKKALTKQYRRPRIQRKKGSPSIMHINDDTIFRGGDCCVSPRSHLCGISPAWCLSRLKMIILNYDAYIIKTLHSIELLRTIRLVIGNARMLRSQINRQPAKWERNYAHREVINKS